MEAEIRTLEQEVLELKQKLLVCLDKQEKYWSETDEQKFEKSVVEALDKEVERYKKLIAIKSDKLAVKMSMIQEPGVSAVHKGDMEESVLSALLSATQKERKAKKFVPSVLPKLKNSEDAWSFIEEFERHMKAHGIEVERYVEILPLCLELSDNKWLEDWLGENVDWDWEALKVAFIQHFQHPQLGSVLALKLQNLKMTEDGVQKYTDEFVRLAGRIGWSLDNAIVISAYKKGLPDWLADSLSISEAGNMTSSSVVGVRVLGQMALKIEAEKRNKTVVASEEKVKFKPMQCFYCKEFGHKKESCPSKPKDEAVKAVKREVKVTTTMDKPLRADETKYHCFKCGKEGHLSPDCPNRTVNVLGVNAENRSHDRVPCTVNGKRILALLDSGAKCSAIRLDIVQQEGWTILPRRGMLIGVLQNVTAPRIGVVEAVLQCGGKAVQCELEVIQCDSECIIGIDLFAALGFKILGLPSDWPEPGKIQPTMVETVEINSLGRVVKRKNAKSSGVVDGSLKLRGVKEGHASGKSVSRLNSIVGHRLVCHGYGPFYEYLVEENGKRVWAQVEQFVKMSPLISYWKSLGLYGPPEVRE